MKATAALVITMLALGLGRGLVIAQTPVGHIPALESIHMIDALIGWAVTHEANTLLRTTDGGNHWRDVNPAGQQNGVGAVAALTARVAWAADAVRIYRTEDGGQTWNQVPSPVGSNGGPSVLHFINTSDGWLLTMKGVWMANEAVDVYRTTDGGETWIRIARAAADDQKSGLPTGGHKGGIAFLNRTTGWITGDSEPAHDSTFLYVTHDSGRTWREQRLPLPPQVTSPWFASMDSPMFFAAEDGILPVFYDLEAPARAIVVFYVTHDGGATWKYTTQVPVVQSWGTPYSFTDMNHGWVVGDGALYETRDGGGLWMRIHPLVSFADVTQIDFVSPQVGWVMSKTFPWLLKTLDGGRTWAPVTYTVERQ